MKMVDKVKTICHLFFLTLVTNVNEYELIVQCESKYLAKSQVFNPK